MKWIDSLTLHEFCERMPKIETECEKQWKSESRSGGNNKIALEMGERERGVRETPTETQFKPIQKRILKIKRVQRSLNKMICLFSSRLSLKVSSGISAGLRAGNWVMLQVDFKWRINTVRCHCDSFINLLSSVITESRALWRLGPFLEMRREGRRKKFHRNRQLSAIHNSVSEPLP